MIKRKKCHHYQKIAICFFGRTLNGLYPCLLTPGRFHHTLARRIHWCRVTIDPRWTLGLVPWFSQLFGVLRAACKYVTIQLDETIITLFLTCRHWSFPNFIDSGPLLLNNSTVSSNDLFCTVTSNLSYFPPKFVSPERSYGDIYLLSKLWIEWSFCGLYVSYEWVQFIVLLLGNIFLQMIKYNLKITQLGRICNI